MINFIKKTCSFLLLIMALAQASFANDNIIDPLNSPSWSVMHQLMLNNEPVIFDDHVEVRIPDFAEDPMNVPVSVRVNGLQDIEEIVVFADLNPIQKVLTFKPININPYIAFRIKVEQGTPVRAAAKTKDGIWHVGGRWLEASGGGCTAPSLGRAADDWHETLLSVSSRTWRDNNQLERLRFRIMHPMDTGLADGIPEFYIQNLTVIDEVGQELAHIDTYQPISENPVFTFDLRNILNTDEIKLVGRDNNGNKLNATIN